MRSFKFLSIICAMIAMATVKLFADATLADCSQGATNKNNFGYYWYFYDDSTNKGQSCCSNASITTPKTSAGYTVVATAGAGYDGYGIVFPYTLGATGITPSHNKTHTNYSFAGMGTMLCAAGKTLDISTGTAVSFWMKADAATTVDFMLVDTVNITDNGNYYFSVPVTTTWTQFTVALSTGDGGVKQPSWAKKVTFSAKTISKFNWQVHSDYSGLGATGTVYIDNIVIAGYTYVARDNGSSLLTTAGSGTGALLSNMDTLPYAKNKRGYYWFAYTDGPGRTSPSASDISQITDGATTDATTLIATLAISGNGYNTTNGAFLSYVLGTTYKNTSNITVQPFVGVGTNLYNETTSSDTYNATADNATGIYFDYQFTPVDTNAMLSMEVYANTFSTEGVVHYLNFPSTKGVWKGASVPFSKLVLPEWEGVNTSEALKTTALKKIQWKAQSSDGSTGSFAIDNVYLLGATKITQSGVKYFNNAAKSYNGFKPSLSNNILKVNFNKGMNNGTISLVNTKGAVIARSNAKDLNAQLNVAGFAKGVYMLVVKSASFEKTVPVTIY